MGSKRSPLFRLIRKRKRAVAPRIQATKGREHRAAVQRESPVFDLLVLTGQNFNRTAQSMNIPFQVVHKKINVSNPDIDWEHEQFSRKRIVGGTLSELDKPTAAFARSHLFDTE